MQNPTTVAPELAYIKETLGQQRAYFRKGETLNVDFRLRYLKKLRDALLAKEDAIHQALHADLGKSAPEAYITETGIIMNDLEQAISATANWAKPRKVGTPLFFLPGTSKIYPEPYGNTLIIAPWNYPYQLLLSPLIGALAAGNTAVLKPSELAPHTAKVVREVVEAIFPSEYVAVVEGGVPESTALLREKWDYIFFTGSTHVGGIVYQAAAKHLTPVTLELGGKSPCIVDKDIHLENTARRIVWGKFVNLGQTCIAPDYLFIHKDVKAALVDKIQEKIKQFYGDDPQQSEDYGRIISHRHFDRLCGLMDKDKIVFGGQTDRADRYIAPTLIDGVSPEDPIMQEEIFGPILPILEWENLDEVTRFVNDRDKPLALYVYTKNKAVSDRVLRECSSGGACINDSVVHIGNPNLPFGGVGGSGIGAYHGRASFDTFSHLKSVLHRSPSIDLDIRYAPWGKNYSKLRFLVKKFL